MANGPTADEHVAAIALVVDMGLAHLHLREGVIDIGVVARRRRDDAGLRQGGDAAAHAVELAAVRIGAAQRRQEDRIPLRPVGWQVAGMEHDGLAGAAAHEHGGNGERCHDASEAGAVDFAVMDRRRRRERQATSRPTYGCSSGGRWRRNIPSSSRS